MEKLLKQDEIDALFETARAASTQAGKQGIKERFLSYDFASAGQISNDQMRAISMLNDLFARNLTHNMAAQPIAGESGLSRADRLQRLSIACAGSELHQFSAAGTPGRAGGGATGHGACASNG